LPYPLQTKKRFKFLTNNFTLPAVTIAQIYKCRWQVELFFKWIKQHLRIKVFFDTSQNAVKTQIWIAVSVYVQVAIVRKRLRLGLSLYRFYRFSALRFFEKTPILRALQPTDSIDESLDSANQLNLFGLIAGHQCVYLMRTSLARNPADFGGRPKSPNKSFVPRCHLTSAAMTVILRPLCFFTHFTLKRLAISLTSMGPQMESFQPITKMSAMRSRNLILPLFLLAALAQLLQAQSVLLTSSPNPSRFGAPVVLTATVTPSTATGHVTFYDGVNVVGIAPVVAGKATISTIALPADNTLLPGGTRKLRALFTGTSSGVGVSNLVSQAVISQPVLRFAAGFSTPIVPSTNVVVADFNGDGKADVAVGESGQSTQVFLGAGDGTFQLSFTFPGAFHVSPVALAAGDFNGDGKIDLAVEDSNNGLVNILLGNGDGTFQGPGTTYSIPTNAGGRSSIAVGDFNGDGKLDLVVANQNLGLLIGNGDGTLQPMLSLSPGPSPIFVVVGDFNGDGKADLVTASGFTKVVSLMLGNGNATFQNPVNFSIPGIATWLAVGDFNQDGYADLVTVNPDTTQAVSNTFFNNVSVLLSAGAGGTFLAPVNYPAGLTPESVAIADFNGDGVSDLLVGNIGGSPSVSVLLGHTDGTFQAATNFPISVRPYSLAAGDFNGDGKTDVAFAGQTTDGSVFTLSTLQGTTLNLTVTGGTPQSAVTGTSFAFPLQVTVMDGGTPVSGVTVNFSVPSSGASAVLSSGTAVTNSAGVASVVATANGTGGSYTVTASALGLSGAFSLTNLVAAPSVFTATPSTLQSTTVGTAFPLPLKVTLTDSAGNPASGVLVSFTAPTSGASAALSSSVVATDTTGSASVTATANNVAGSYTVTASALGLTASFQLSNVNPISVSLSSPSNTSTFGGPVTLTVTVAPATATGKVTFYDGVTILGTKPLSSGTASLTTILLPMGARRISAFYSGDPNFMATTSNTIVETVKANGGGVGFLAQTPVSIAPAAPTSVVVGDFNGDNKADITLPGGQNGPATVTVALGKGDGTFQAPVIYPVGTGPTAVAVGDFDGDGKSDLAVTNFGDSTVSILLGNGDGTFRSGLAYPTGGSPTSIAVADFNGDGIADLVVGGAGLSIMIGKGDGSFNAPVSLPNLANPSSVVVGDFNGDGKADLGVWAPAGSSLQILLGNGNGTFQNGPVALSLASVQANLSGILTTADFNNDGKADISVTGPRGSFILLGNGDGTFQSSAAQSTLGTVAGDFNGDNLPDLAGVNANNLFVTYGNGDGTFQPPATFIPPKPPVGLAVADFNGDGMPDIITANTNGGVAANGTVTVFLGVVAGTILTASGGTPQSTFVGTAFPVPLQVTLVSNGAPVPNALITFAAPPVGASATLSSITVFTNASGIATVNATANTLAGSYVVSAIYQGLTATFNLTNTAIASLTASGGTPQATLLGTTFPSALQVTVKDTAGNPVSGANVSFAAPASGASAVLSSNFAVTNSAGVASVTATANNTAGSYSVTASIGTLSVAFSLTNTSAAPGSITASGGTPQVALLGSPFPNPLQALVKDASGNPVTGATVTFSAPTSGASASLSSTTAVTNSFGVAGVTATANNIVGSYTVTATVGGLSTTFSLSNALGGGTNLALGRTATQSSTLSGSSGPSAAVDGNTDGAFFDGSVTATNPDTNAWWQVDLGSSATINSITIWNRTDCCGTRLSDFWVFVSNTPFLATDTPATLQNRAGTFASHQTSAPNPSTTINVGGAPGQYVRVQLTGTDYLSLAEVMVSGTGGSPTPTNLSKGKVATQSSTLSGAPGAGVAVDGNTDGAFFDGSVTATNPDLNAWWQVDLGSVATISSVTIWNRTDCCGTRLSDYWVFVSNTPFLPTDTPATLQNRAGTVASHQTSAPNPSVSIPFGAQGRYVRVQLSGQDYLSLAEVQVFGSGPPSTNVSQGKIATQSSSYPGSPSANVAIDGNTDGNYFDGSVTATNTDSNAWWQVDLGASAAVSSISIFNRTDCCGTRLNDYWIFISDTPFLSSDTPTTLQNRAGTFASHQTSAPSPSATISLTAQGRYVRIQLSGTNILSLAEVQVFGSLAATTPTNVALGKVASQSTTFPGYLTDGASSAIDGNTDGAFFDGSVTATNQENNPWWQVDLGVSTAVSTMTIYNRTDCCGSRLSDYWIFISDTPFQAADTPTTLQNRAGTYANHQTSAPSPSATIPVSTQGRYVRIQLSTPNILSLAEVQIFANQ